MVTGQDSWLHLWLFVKFKTLHFLFNSRRRLTTVFTQQEILLLGVKFVILVDILII